MTQDVLVDAWDCANHVQEPALEVVLVARLVMDAQVHVVVVVLVDVAHALMDVPDIVLHIVLNFV